MDATRSIYHAISFYVPLQRISKQGSNGGFPASREDQFCEKALERTLKMVAFLEADYFSDKILLVVLPFKHISDQWQQKEITT